MPADYLMQMTTATPAETRHYVVRPGACRKDQRHKLGEYEPCWIEVGTGAIMSPNHDWVISIAELEERISE